jgi:hypothetical protein
MEKRKKPTREQIDAIIGREAIERWERTKRMFEERLEYHRRRKLEEKQAADGQG